MSHYTTVDWRASIIGIDNSKWRGGLLGCLFGVVYWCMAFPKDWVFQQVNIGFLAGTHSPVKLVVVAIGVWISGFALG